MTSRTISRTITFRRPFKLSGMESELPAGSYVVETDEELLQGLSFPAYRRTATYLIVPSTTGGTVSSETIRADPAELQAALTKELQAVSLTGPGRGGVEATFNELLASPTLQTAVSSTQLTLDEFEAQFRILMKRWQNRRTADRTLPVRQAARRPNRFS